MYYVCYLAFYITLPMFYIFTDVNLYTYIN